MFTLIFLLLMLVFFPGLLFILFLLFIGGSLTILSSPFTWGIIAMIIAAIILIPRA